MLNNLFSKLQLKIMFVSYTLVNSTLLLKIKLILQRYPPFHSSCFLFIANRFPRFFQSTEISIGLKFTDRGNLLYIFCSRRHPPPNERSSRERRTINCPSREGRRSRMSISRLNKSSRWTRCSAPLQ